MNLRMHQPRRHLRTSNDFPRCFEGRRGRRPSSVHIVVAACILFMVVAPFGCAADTNETSTDFSNVTATVWNSSDSTTLPTITTEPNSGGKGGGGGGSPSACVATFSIPLADTYTTRVADLPNLPSFAPLARDGEPVFTYYKISSVALSRAGDLLINVALTHGAINTSYSLATTAGLTPLTIAEMGGGGGGGGSSKSNSSTSGSDDRLSALYATVYDRYMGYGQFASAEAQAATNLAELRETHFEKDGGSEVLGDGRFLVSAKSRLMGTLMVPGDFIDVSDDFDSKEGHGIADMISKKYGRIDVSTTASFMTITLRSFSGYRIANDQYVYFNFFNNFTDPPGCLARHPLVLHITGFQPSALSEVASFGAFAVLVCGLVLMLFGTLVPTSHHAGAVGVLVVSRFAHEDGQPLSFVLSPLQASIGTDKYQYVLGAVVSDCAIVVIVAIAQVIAVRFFRHKCLPAREAAGVTRWPFISIAFFTHFCPQIFFLLGRLLGRISLTSIITASVVILLMAATVVTIAKKVLSASDNFGAFLDTSETSSRRYRRMRKDRDARPLPSQFGAKAGEVFGAAQLRDDPLLERLPVFGGMFKSRGEWVARQPVNFLLERWGYVFVPYRKKHWLIIEYADAMICGLISVLDNYTSALAMYQHGIFCLSKLAILVLIIAIRPALKTLDTNIMFLSYAGQLLACVALFVGSIKAQLVESFAVVKDVALVFVAAVLGAHILLTLFESVRGFYRRIRHTDERRAAYAMERQRHAFLTEMLEREDAAKEAAAAASGAGRGGDGAGLRRRRLHPLGIRHAESTLLASLVEGHLPGSVGALQVAERNVKFDPQHILPAQDAFRIHSDGTITVIPAAVGGVGRAYDGLTTDDVEQRNNQQALGSKKKVTKKRNPQRLDADGNVILEASYNTANNNDDEDAEEPLIPALRPVTNAEGRTVMVAPVFATWGLDDSTNSDDSNDNGPINSRRSVATSNRRGGGGASAVGSSRRSGTTAARSAAGASGVGTLTRFGGRAVLSGAASDRSRGSSGGGGYSTGGGMRGGGGSSGGRRSYSSSSSEDSDSGFDSEGLPVTSVEQRLRKQARRAERSKRRADRLMRRQQVVDADGDVLIIGDDEEGVDDDGDDVLAFLWDRDEDSDGGLLLHNDGDFNSRRRRASSSILRGGSDGYGGGNYGGNSRGANGGDRLSRTSSSMHHHNNGYSSKVTPPHRSSSSAAFDTAFDTVASSPAALLRLSASANTTVLARGGALPLSDAQRRQRARAERRRQRREQRQLNKGIVTTTADLVRSIPDGGVSIAMFNTFVDSVPGLSNEEKSRHKRRLADKIRTIFRDKAREAANKRMQEKVKQAMLLDETMPQHIAANAAAASTTNTGIRAPNKDSDVDPANGGVAAAAAGTAEVRVSRQINAALQMGGIRGMYYRKEAAERAAAEAEAARQRQESLQRLVAQQQAMERERMQQQHRSAAALRAAAEEGADLLSLAAKGGGSGGGVGLSTHRLNSDALLQLAQGGDGAAEGDGASSAGGSMAVGTGAAAVVNGGRGPLVLGRLGLQQQQQQSSSSGGSNASGATSSYDETSSDDDDLHGLNGAKQQQQQQRRRDDGGGRVLRYVDDEGNVFEFDKDELGSQWDDSQNGDDDDDGGDRDDMLSVASGRSQRSHRSMRSYASRMSTASRRSARSTHNTLSFRPQQQQQSQQGKNASGDGKGGGGGKGGGKGKSKSGGGAAPSAAGSVVSGLGGGGGVSRPSASGAIRWRRGMTSEDIKLEEEIARQKQLNKALNLRYASGGKKRNNKNGGGAAGLDHDWLVLGDDVQARAALHAVRMIDTMEAAAAHASANAAAAAASVAVAAHAGASSVSSPQKHAIVDVPASPRAKKTASSMSANIVGAAAIGGTSAAPTTAAAASAGGGPQVPAGIAAIQSARQADAAKQRLAHQTGTLIAVWESIGSRVGQLRRDAEAGRARNVAEGSIYTMGFSGARPLAEEEKLQRERQLRQAGEELRRQYAVGNGSAGHGGFGTAGAAGPTTSGSASAGRLASQQFTGV